MEIAKRPVVADPDTAFLQKLFYECGDSSSPPLVVNSAEKLQDIIQREPYVISAVFLNPRLISTGASIMSALRENLPNTPLFYIIEEAMNPPDESDLPILTVAECLRKPFHHSEIERALTQSLMQFGKKSALAENDPLDREFDESDENFCPIRARNFLPGKESFFDLYERVRPGRFTKTLGAGDLFSQDLLDRHLRRGMEHFFIRRAAQHRYLERCRKVSEAILGGQQAAAKRVSGPPNLGEEGIRFLRANGVREAAIDYALQFAKKSLALSVQLAQDEYVLKHLSDPVNLDHSISVSMFSSLLAAHLKLEQSRAPGIVGVAAILHDVGMIHIAKELHHANPEDLNCEELDIFEAHPMIGQEMLKKIPGIDPAVTQAVAQHHERQNGQGFPNKPARISAEAEIIGLSEEFLKQLIRARKNPGIQVMKKMEKRLGGFSPPTAAAFREIFGRASLAEEGNP